MNRFSPEQLQVWSGGEWLNGNVPPVVTGFTNDTRAIAPGDCFVALKTDQRDGHAFLATAAASGASAALVTVPDAGISLPQLVVRDTLEALQRIARHWRERFRSPVFGVTGSVGKTSTKDLLKKILGENAFATEANLNNLLGVPLMLLRMNPAKHFSGAVIEAGMSEPGELERAGWMIQPDFAVITNVEAVHLAGVGSLENIAREKSALARQTSARGVTVFPAACLRFSDFRELHGRIIPVIFPGDARPANKGYEDIFTVTFSEKKSGRVIGVTGDGGVAAEFDFPESTLGMARNAALVAVTALLAGVSTKCIQDAFLQWRPSARRGEMVTHGGRLFYIDCYNASPASVMDAAKTFDTVTAAGDGGRMFVLAGMNELGDASAALHENVGRQLPLRAGDVLVLFGGDSAAMGDGAVAAGFSSESIFFAKDIDAVRAAIEKFSGAVMVKGSRAYALERALSGLVNC